VNAICNSVDRNFWKYLGLCSALLLLSVIGCTVFLSGCGEKPQSLDSTDLVKPEVARPPDDDKRPVLRVAVATMIAPETTRDYYEELVRLIGYRVGCRVIFSQRRTYAEVNTMLKNREVDLAFICTGPYTKGHDEFGLELLAIPIMYGKRVYYSYIITRADSAALSLDDLRGECFAFSDPDSGAAVDSLVWHFMEMISPELTGRTRVIKKSPPYGMPPVVVHPDLSPNLKSKLKNALLVLHENEKAAALMKQIGIDHFGEEKWRGIEI